jgi:hypothetical protein
MARRRRTRSRSAPLVRTVRAPAAQVIRVSAPAPVRRRTRVRRAIGNALNTQRVLALGLGGLALGMIEKALPNLPTIPMLGRKGTLALACYWFSRGQSSGILRDIAIAASSIAGYELGTTGKISGDYDSDVRGVAAQV